MPDRPPPNLLSWQYDVLERLATGQPLLITVPRRNGRTTFRRWVRSWDDVHALVFLHYLKVWDAPGGTLELEPPRRPPSWYPGQPDPPKPRRWPCTCFYGLRHVENAPGPYAGPAGWTRCFVIVWDCPHHGDDLLDIEAELDDLYPDGGVWGFTADDC